MHVDLPEKLYYTIGEVARAFNVNTSLLRFWEKNFDIIQPKKNKKGNRYFSPEDVQNLKVIYHLVKEKGYTLEGAEQALRERKNIDQEVALISRLEWVKAELEIIKKSLDDLED